MQQKETFTLRAGTAIVVKGVSVLLAADATVTSADAHMRYLLMKLVNADVVNEQWDAESAAKYGG